MLALCVLLPVAACNNDNPAVSNVPTGPTAVAADVPLAVQSIATVPDGAGVQYNTDFQFSANGSFPAGTQFTWRFGDGSSTTTSSPAVGRVFGQAGVFDVSVEARQGGASGAAFKQVSVRSLVGRWFGTMTGHTRFPAARPQAITSFELLVTSQSPAADGRSLMLTGRWADSAGCRENRAEFLRQIIQPEPTATVTFGVHALSCADGDFFLTGLADAAFNAVEGHCNVSGGNPNCRFSMRRE
jgi:hypothetical protein